MSSPQEAIQNSGRFENVGYASPGLFLVVLFFALVAWIVTAPVRWYRGRSA